MKTCLQERFKQLKKSSRMSIVKVIRSVTGLDTLSCKDIGNKDNVGHSHGGDGNRGKDWGED